MEQEKNIIQSIGNFVEEKGSSWIFPHKDESIKDAGNTILSVLFFIVLYIIVFAVRSLFLFAKLIITLVVNYDNSHNSNKTTIISKHIARTALYGLLISFLIFFSIRILHNSAKETNVSLKADRDLYGFSPDAISEYMPEDTILNGAFNAIYEALENDYTDRDVVRLKKHLSIDGDFASGLHFQSPDAFMLYLYSIKDINKDVRCYINEADSIGTFSEMLDYYQAAALEDYKSGNYYNASAEMKHFFNIYNNQSDYTLSGINNKMHLLKILLQRQWDLTTNREFADVALSCINSEELLEPNRFSEYEKLKSISKDNPYLQNISDYFEGLYLFYNKEYISALQQFKLCHERAADSTLKQYSALMSIRTAFWYYDNLRDDQALALYRKVYGKYSKEVTLCYFEPDLQRYQYVVQNIIENPQYTGVDDILEDD